MQNYLQPQYRQFMQPAQYQQQTGYRVFPIANETEINNTTVDFNGMPTYFHNQSTNEIYIKQFDFKTGLTNTQKYIKYEPAQTGNIEQKHSESINQYSEDLKAINERLDGLQSLIEKINKQEDVKVVKNAK